MRKVPQILRVRRLELLAWLAQSFESETYSSERGALSLFLPTSAGSILNVSVRRLKKFSYFAVAKRKQSYNLHRFWHRFADPKPTPDVAQHPAKHLYLTAATNALQSPAAAKFAQRPVSQRADTP